MAIEHVLERSIGAVAAWIEENDYQGYDPGDGLNSFLRPLAFGNSLLERILLQFVWKAPVNVRPFIGIRPSDSTRPWLHGGGVLDVAPSHWRVRLVHDRLQFSLQSMFAASQLRHSLAQFGNHPARAVFRPAG